MPSYPADLSVPNPTQWYEKGGEMLLFGIRDVETLVCQNHWCARERLGTSE